jgi:glycosyltransferase involved in cell wall biosynthesis
MQAGANSCIREAMNIAFYAPLKPPDHPAPSGDREMANLLIQALERGGHRVDVASKLRAFVQRPEADAIARLETEARLEVARLDAEWRAGEAPHLWFCYHSYYKAPDLLGPVLARRHGVGYVTAEASYAAKRDAQGWSALQAKVVDGVKMAALNICFTERDQAGLKSIAPKAAYARLQPFIDTERFARVESKSASAELRLVAVAMLRHGDKFNSFNMLARSLALLGDVDWRLTIIGDGPAREEVRNLFQSFPSQRIEWAGEMPPGSVGQYLERADIYVWPGCGEAYGLAYLEAQAAGLPVVAQDTAGVPEVVQNGVTGILTPDGNTGAFAAAIERLAGDGVLRRRMSERAREFVLGERSLAIASSKLNLLLHKAVAAKVRA